ncbi:MAG: ATP-binding protein [Thermodesulfobacteriota bacterium]|nr:ATP-binding protein [Thermodesulfobacteriota bacterium]
MFKTMMEGAGLPLMITDSKGRIIFANRCLEDFMGYTRTEFLKSNLRDLCVPYEQDRYIFSCLPDIKRTTEVDIDLLQKNGEVFTANASFAPFNYRQARHLLIIFRDVTSRRIREAKTREDEERYRRLLIERNMLQDQLHRCSKVAFMGELAAGIAHEINNPLGIILGFVQDILEEIPLDDPLIESIKIIEKETARCIDVVKNLLDFARLKPPERIPVDIVDLLENTTVLMTPKIKKNKVSIKRNFEKKLPLVKVDPQLIQQVFLNVMINAIQAMPDTGVLAFDIGFVRKARLQEFSDWIRISISDTGKGISKKVLHRVFDPFFTTKGSKGTGLGLSICQRIMEDHKGKIEIKNQKEAGTICSLYFPIKD